MVVKLKKTNKSNAKNALFKYFRTEKVLKHHNVLPCIWGVRNYLSPATTWPINTISNTPNTQVLRWDIYFDIFLNSPARTILGQK